jgi:hypothetical protein
MFFLMDNCFHHHSAQLLKCFVTDDGKPLPIEKRLIYVNLDEDSLRVRKGCVRPGTSFDCVEHMHIITKHDFVATIPHCKRRHFSGTNISNKFGDVILPPFDALWSLPCKVKNDVHGAYRVPCGGPTPNEESVGTGTKRKTLATVEPVFWRGRPLRFYETLLADYFLTAIVDLTVGDGTLLIHCAKERIPYIGFALSERHAELIKHRAVQQVLESMFVPGERECNPELAAMMQKTGATVGAQGNETVPKPPDPSSSSTTNPLADFQAKLEAFKRKAEGAGTADASGSKKSKGDAGAAAAEVGDSQE